MNRLAGLLHLRQWRELRALAKKREFGMASQAEQHWLRTYAAWHYRGTGAIVDLGCFLGATTIALAQGLVLNSRAKQKQIHAYDLFRWEAGYEAWTKGREVEGLFSPGNSFLGEFLRRTETWKDYIVVHEGDLSRPQWDGGRIEFLFIDAMKSPEIATAIASAFFPHLAPGQSYVAHQDFPHAFTPWIHLLAYRLRNHFRFIEDMPQSSLFRLERAIAPELVRRDLAPAAVSTDEIEAAFDYSLGLVVEKRKKANVIAAKAMAYFRRGEFGRAYEIINSSRYGPRSRADEFNKVKALIERNLGAMTR
jgi:hypothetical protein